MSGAYGFSANDAARIGRAVRRVESLPDRRGGRRDYSGRPETFRAIVGASDGLGKYEWAIAKFDPASGDWSEGEATGGNLYEVQKCRAIPEGACVEAWLAGYDSDDNPVYLCDAPGPHVVRVSGGGADNSYSVIRWGPSAETIDINVGSYCWRGPERNIDAYVGLAATDPSSGRPVLAVASGTYKLEECPA